MPPGPGKFATYFGTFKFRFAFESVDLDVIHHHSYLTKSARFRVKGLPFPPEDAAGYVGTVEMKVEYEDGAVWKIATNTATVPIKLTLNAATFGVNIVDLSAEGFNSQTNFRVTALTIPKGFEFYTRGWPPPPQGVPGSANVRYFRLDYLEVDSNLLDAKSKLLFPSRPIGIGNKYPGDKPKPEMTGTGLSCKMGETDSPFYIACSYVSPKPDKDSANPNWPAVFLIFEVFAKDVGTALSYINKKMSMWAALPNANTLATGIRPKAIASTGYCSYDSSSPYDYAAFFSEVVPADYVP